nr:MULTISPECIES: FAD-binding protein [unclassified Fusibacter]
MVYDIVIVGAGPAGSNLARLLSTRTDYSVCLVDKRRLDEHVDEKRRKACGGLLSPDAQHMLAKLGLTIPVSILEDPQLFSVRTIDFDNGLDCHYQRFYYNMDREKFDRYLFNLIPESVTKVCGAVVKGAKRTDLFWSIEVEHASQKTIKGNYLVVADGANSLLRKNLLSGQRSPKKYISIQKWYPMTKDMPYYTGIFDSDVTDYYSWTIQKDSSLILGTAVPLGENAHEKFELLRSKTAKYLDLPLDEPVRTEGAFIERTMHLKDLKWNGDGFAIIGEAAGATSPTSAEGFSYALKSSLYLAEELCEGFENIGERYRRRCRKIALNILGKQLKSPAMYQKNIRKMVIKSGVTAMNMSEKG